MISFSSSSFRALRVLSISFLVLAITACGSTAGTSNTIENGPFAVFLQGVEVFNTQDPLAIVETDQGTFAIELLKNQFPNSVAHFIAVATSAHYDNSTVYNAINNFAVYMGDKSGSAQEVSDVNTLPLETHPDIQHNTAGVVGFVHQSGAQCVSSPNKEQCAKDALNSAKTFFYVTLSAQPSLDGSYAPFGKIVKGLEIVKNLHRGNKINKVTIVSR